MRVKDHIMAGSKLHLRGNSIAERMCHLTWAAAKHYKCSISKAAEDHFRTIQEDAGIPELSRNLTGSAFRARVFYFLGNNPEFREALCKEYNVRCRTYKKHNQRGHSNLGISQVKAIPKGSKISQTELFPVKITANKTVVYSLLMKNKDGHSLIDVFENVTKLTESIELYALVGLDLHIRCHKIDLKEMRKGVQLKEVKI